MRPQELVMHTCGHVDSTASATADSNDRDRGGVKSPTPAFRTRISGEVHEGLLKLWMTNGVVMLASNLLMFSLTPSKLSTTAARVSRSPPDTKRTALFVDMLSGVLLDMYEVSGSPHSRYVPAPASSTHT